jgi:hypothetical protein
LSTVLFLEGPVADLSEAVEEHSLGYVFRASPLFSPAVILRRKFGMAEASERASLNSWAVLGGAPDEVRQQADELSVLLR